MEVGQIKTPEAAELFQRSAKIMKARLEEQEEIDGIVEEPGCLAIVITLAGSYVSVAPRLLSDIALYLPEYRQRRKKLLQQQSKQHMHRYKGSVLSIQEASFEAIAKQDPAAVRLLCILAFMNFKDIFPDLIGGDEIVVLDGGP